MFSAFYAGCTLSPREPETRRKQECRWEHSPRLGSSRVASALVTRLVKFSLFSGLWARVKGSRVLPGCCLVSRAKIESSWQECTESHLPNLVSGSSCPRLSPNALGESVQPALHTQLAPPHINRLKCFHTLSLISLKSFWVNIIRIHLTSTFLQSSSKIFKIL